jgi:hypothetical protein
VSGYIKLHRGWRDNPIFKGEYSRADAWVWLLEQACWRETKARIKGESVTLQRGELTFSIRFMADAWGWSKSRVDRFLADLRAESMIETRSKIGTTAGRKAGQGQSILSICNYAKYQDRDGAQRDNDSAEIGTTAGQQRDKEEEVKEDKKEENTHYAFFGRVIRLNSSDYARWKTRYHALADLEGELGSLDDWLNGQDEKTRKGWFHIVSGSLNKKHQAAMKAARSDDGWGEEYLGP